MFLLKSNISFHSFPIPLLYKFSKIPQKTPNPDLLNSAKIQFALVATSEKIRQKLSAVTQPQLEESPPQKDCLKGAGKNQYDEPCTDSRPDARIWRRESRRAFSGAEASCRRLFALFPVHIQHFANGRYISPSSWLS